MKNNNPIAPKRTVGFGMTQMQTTPKVAQAKIAKHLKMANLHIADAIRLIRKARQKPLTH